MRNKAAGKAGFTLIEVIVSLAIIGIIAISFISIFSTGVLWVSKAGGQSSSAFSAQKDLENAIANDINGTDTISIIFNGVTLPAVAGKSQSVTKTYRNNEYVTISVFIPN
jgi:prepilin-type N-terminal cleavage/methylation domain-containing protein